MTAAEHRAQAERLLAMARAMGDSDANLPAIRWAAIAQVHATLATIPDPMYALPVTYTHGVTDEEAARLRERLRAQDGGAL